MADGKLEFRLKCKRSDGESLPYKSFKDGTTQHAQRVTLAAVFNRDGMRGVQFEEPIREAIKAALGVPKDVKLYFDLFVADRPAPGDAGAAEDLDF